jgi:hypothetical protein
MLAPSGAAQEARERALVVPGVVRGHRQGPGINRLQADAPQAAPVSPDMQMVAGLGLGIVDVLLAQQARGRLERGHERVLPGQLTEVQAFAEPDTGQLRTVHGDGGAPWRSPTR